MKWHLLALLTLSACATASEMADEQTKECCEMTVNEGQFNRTGIRILKKSETDSLDVPPNGAIAYLHFVDSAGDTIVPEYVSQGLQTYAGPLSGAKIAVVSPEEIENLETQVSALENQAIDHEARIQALEALLAAATAENTPGTLVKRDVNGDIFTANFRGNLKEASNGGFVKILAYGNQEVVRFGFNGGPALRFYDGGTIVQQQSVSETDPNLAVTIADKLAQFGFVTVTP